MCNGEQETCVEILEMFDYYSDERKSKIGSELTARCFQIIDDCNNMMQSHDNSDTKELSDDPEKQETDNQSADDRGKSNDR